MHMSCGHDVNALCEEEQVEEKDQEKEEEMEEEEVAVAYWCDV